MSKQNKIITPATPDAKSYCNTKGIANYGIPTGILCLIIYYFLKGDAMKYIGIGADLWIGVFVTVFICTLTAVLGIKSDMKKGKAPYMPLNAKEHNVYRHISDNLVVMSIEFGILATLIFAMIPGGIFATIASMTGDLDKSIAPNTYWILKSIYSGIFVAITMKWVTYCTVAKNQIALGAEVR